MPAIGVMPRKVEKIHSREDDEESTQQGDCVDCVGGIEALEENERRAERSRRERHVVEGVNTIRADFISTRLGKIYLDFLAVPLTSRSRKRSMPC